MLPLLLLAGNAAGLQSGAAIRPVTSSARAPLLHGSPRHPVLVAAARKPATAAAAENPARPLQLTAFVFVLGLSLVTLTPAKEVVDRMGTGPGMQLLTLLSTASAAAEIALSPLIGSLTDSVGRKPVLLVTVASVAAVNLATAVCPTVPLIALSKLVSSLVVGIFFLAAGAHPRSSSSSSSSSSSNAILICRNGRVLIQGSEEEVRWKGTQPEWSRLIIFVAGAILADRLRDDPAQLAAASGSLFAVVNGGFGLGIAISELLPRGLRVRYGISALVSLLGVGLAARVRESLTDEDRLPFQARAVPIISHPDDLLATVLACTLLDGTGRTTPACQGPSVRDLLSCMCTACAPPAPCLRPACALPAPCLRPAYALPVHCVHTAR